MTTIYIQQSHWFHSQRNATHGKSKEKVDMNKDNGYAST